MGKEKHTEKEKFKTVAFFRKVKEQIAEETYGMSFKELKAHLQRRRFKTEN